jgi:SAM-dependent methyltransferase
MAGRRGKLGRDQRLTTQCIACRNTATQIGEVPYAYHFLQLKFPMLDTGDLYECTVCGLWFKYPYLSEERIAEYYRNSPDHFSWDDSGERKDFSYAASAIAESFAEGGSILDFGCYKGGFLRLLPDRFRKHGIEPSAAAAAAASEFGIEILGKDLSALEDRKFHSITLFDVFEHLTDPVGTLDTLFAHLRPGGLLCIGTGFADAPSFHRSGSKYCYVCLPEHVCFLTKRFLHFLADRYQSEYGFSMISKNGWSLRWGLRAAAINSLNLPMHLLKTKKAIYKWYPSHRLKVVTSRGFMPFLASDDHAVAVFRKGTSVVESGTISLG